MTNINFIASEVEYTEAIDGEIVQFYFDEDPNQDPLNRTKCYLMVSQNYEFPGKPTVEWHDENADDGGEEVVNYLLTKNIFELTTTNNLKFKIQHNCQRETFNLIQKFLYHEFGNGK
jgi:hypothetical protein